MSQSAYKLDLRDLMDDHYGPGNWVQRTTPNTGTDIGPALTLGLKQLRVQFGRGKIEIPPGTWTMEEAPSPSDLSGNYIEGAGSQASLIVYKNTSGVAFYFNGSGGYTGGGIRGVGILLETGLGNTSSYGILLSGDAAFQPDQTEFEDIYLSAVGGTSYWWDGFHANGTARTVPQGIRVGSINNMQIFNCRNIGFYGANLVQWTLTNIGVYTGIGTGNGVYITGAGTPLKNSTHVDGRLINGALVINNTLDVTVNGTKYS